MQAGALDYREAWDLLRGPGPRAKMSSIRKGT